MSNKAKSNPFDHWNAENSNRFALNCDWLQLHVTHKAGLLEVPESFLIEKTGQSKVFRSIYTIIHKKHNRIIATYATDVLEQIMPEHHGILKIENFYLYYYSSRLKAFVEWLLRRLQMNFIGITRIDIAYDFNLFCNKKDPETFIKNFLSNNIVKLKKTKFRLAGEHDKINHFNWIAFGSKTSAVNYKLYNKSLEMRQKTHKAHIWQDWNNSKLDVKKDVWRIEFTVNSNTNLLYNSSDNFNFHDLKTIEITTISGLFKHLFRIYFDFRKYEKLKLRKDRMEKIQLLIFPTFFNEFVIKKINRHVKDVDRSTKIFIKKMNGLGDELRGKDDDFVYDAKELISKLISVYNLQDWAGKKGIEFQKNTYVNDLDV